MKKARKHLVLLGLALVFAGLLTASQPSRCALAGVNCGCSWYWNYNDRPVPGSNTPPRVGELRVWVMAVVGMRDKYTGKPSYFRLRRSSTPLDEFSVSPQDLVLTAPNIGYRDTGIVLDGSYQVALYGYDTNCIGRRGRTYPQCVGTGWLPPAYYWRSGTYLCGNPGWGSQVNVQPLIDAARAAGDSPLPDPTGRTPFGVIMCWGDWDEYCETGPGANGCGDQDFNDFVLLFTIKSPSTPTPTPTFTTTPTPSPTPRGGTAIPTIGPRPTLVWTPRPWQTATPTLTPTPTRTPTPTATATPTAQPLSAGLTADYGGLVYYGPLLGMPTQRLRGTVTGGTPPYTAQVTVTSPDGTVTTYTLPPSLVLDDTLGGTYFGVDAIGTWSAVMTVQDAAGRTANSPAATWLVSWYPVHEQP